MDHAAISSGERAWAPSRRTALEGQPSPVPGPGPAGLCLNKPCSAPHPASSPRTQCPKAPAALGPGQLPGSWTPNRLPLTSWSHTSSGCRWPSLPTAASPGPEEASRNTWCQAQMTEALQGPTTCSGFADGLGRQSREQSVLTSGTSCKTLGPPGRSPGGHTVQPHHCLRPAALLPTIGCSPEGGGRGELAARREALTQVQEVSAAGRGRSTVGRREGWWDCRRVRIEKFAEEIRIGAGLGVAV